MLSRMKQPSIVMSLFCLLLGSACGDDAAEVRRFSPAELRAALAAGTAMALDVRDQASFWAAHVKGAVNIPQDQLATRSHELRRDLTVVAYCS